tara:strand:- start:17072 stop:18424 length:1353 start_codon:yes stop_codon:yes gene_type:complete
MAKAVNKGTSTELTPANHVDEAKAAAFDLEPHRVKMMLDEPFFAGVLRGVNYERTNAIPTAGVLAKDGDVHMWWNPQFLAGLTGKQVKGLLKHEAMHLALEHTTSRRMEPHIIHNYATDLAINSDIPEDELPEGGLIPGKAFKELSEEDKEKMGAEAVDRYYRVSDKIASFPKGESSEWYFTKLMEDPQIADDIENGQKGDPGDGPGEGVPGLPGGMDEHSGWDELSDEERELVKGKIAKAVEDAVKDCDRTGRWGSVGGSMRATLRELISKEVDWRSVLRKFCGLSRRADRRSNVRRLNRKYTGIHPGVERGYTSSIAVYIDQSGSVGNAELELAFGELRNLARRTQFTTFHFDTAVDTDSETEWRRGKTPEAKRTRCGGTDFQCVTKHANANSARFDGYIIITDGEAPKPTPSKLKRGWLLVPGTKLIFDPDNRDFVMKMKTPAKKAA